MKNRTLLLLACIGLFLSVAALGQNVPTCNSFAADGITPIYSTVGYPDTSGTPACTDFFGVANYANSPLPIGPLDISASGFRVMNSGAGYTAPVITITDFYATPGAVPPASCTANVVGGAITGVMCSDGGSGFMAPVVNIADPTGSGAMVLAQLDASKAAGGMHKFLDALPDLKATIPTPDTNTFSGSDFYVIGLVQYQQRMHSDLPPTTLRGYCQLAGPSSTTCVAGPSYLGPVIVAQKNRPVRVLFKNLLPVGAAGNLFIPADTTYMGMGNDPNGTAYTENRAVVHLHGGATPWISDGTPHQWTVPEGESQTVPQRGASVAFVPDMWFDGTGNFIASCAGLTTCTAAGATNDPGQGNLTYYYTNQQGGRLMFYHDHAYGTTRLNVYAGMAAGYLIVDPAEEDALAAAGVPGTMGTAQDAAHMIPLVIQDKTFVPSAPQLAGEDPTWAFTHDGGTIPGSVNEGDLWLNHVYPPNQDPNSDVGANAFGRWDYGPWFFPPQTSLTAANPPTAITIPCTSAAYPGQLLQSTLANPVGGCPIIPNPSGTPESFMDTPLVNGMAYPVLHVKAEPYRFRILSVGNDRTLHLSMYQTCSDGGYSSAVTNCAAASAAGVADKEIPMVPAVQGGPGTGGYVYPDQLDGRDGGVPDSSAAGPSWLQIGSEGGVLPQVAVIPAMPVGYEYGRRSITVLNVSTHGLLLGPAERADVVVDFSKYAGKTLILYNDAPAPIPAFDSRIDYFTGDQDQVQEGGAPSTLPGYGPNTRTVMQIVVDPGSGASVDVAGLKAAMPAIFATSNAGLPAIVPEPTYPIASGGNSATTTYGRIQDNTISFTPNQPLTIGPNDQCISSPNPPSVCLTYGQKAIQELFTLDYGRMNATLGVELPFTNFITQTTIPYGYVDWPTELLQDGQTQIWKLTHNGVDTHFIHFHLFNVQVINRIGWDGMVKPPDANELGWKETVRMNPLEDIVFALKPVKPNLPWPIPDSIRLNDTTTDSGMQDPMISGLNPVDGNATITNRNQVVNFGWEYVWHCHILGHEENDMMRPVIFQAAPGDPSGLNATMDSSGNVALTWTDGSASETSFEVQRAEDTNFTVNPTNLADAPPSPSFGNTVTSGDTGLDTSKAYFYRVRAVDTFTPASPLPAPWQPAVMYSNWSNVAPAQATAVAPAVTFTGAPAAAQYGATFTVIATTNASSMPSIGGTPGICSVGAVTGSPSSSSALVTMTSGTGTCTLTANWAADAFFFAASAMQTTNATLANPSVTFTGAPTSAGNGSAFTVTATSTAGTAPAITGTAGLCTAGPVSGSSPATSLITMTAGSGTCTMTATWAADSNYLGATATQTTTAGPAAPTITWVPASPITYGTALGAAQLNAAASFNGNSVAGTFAYTPVAGTVLLVGTRTLSVTFTPTDTVNFSTATATASLVVNPAPLTITANSTTKLYGQTLTFTGTEFSTSGLVSPDTVTSVTLSSPGTAATAAVGPYSITASNAVGTGLSNYTIGYAPGTLTVNKAGSTTAIVSQVPTPSIVGQIVTVGVQVAPQFTGVPTGTVTITATSGQSCTATLAGGAGNCNLTLSAGGVITLTAAYNGDTNFLTSSTTASHIVTSVDLSTKLLTFGNQTVGTTSATQQVTLTNVGTTPLHIVSITWTAPFIDSTTCPVGGNLNAGSSCRINVRFAPTTMGVANGTLTITTNDPALPVATVAMTGTGVQVVASVSPTLLNFGTVRRGQTSAPQIVTVANTGNATLTFATGNNAFRLGGPDASQFVVTGGTCRAGGSVAPLGSCTITVSFAPSNRTTAGTKSASLSIGDNASNSPQIVSLTGVAQ